MTSSATQGIKTVLHPVTDLGKAKAVYTALLGQPPAHDAAYYVGYDVAGQHIGLVPNGGAAGHDQPGGLLARPGHQREAGRGHRRGRHGQGRPRAMSAWAAWSRPSPTPTATCSACSRTRRA